MGKPFLPFRRWAKRAFRFRVVTLLALTLVAAIWFAFKFYREPITSQNLSLLRPIRTIEKDVWQIRSSPDRTRLALVSWEQPVDIREMQTLLPIQTLCQSRKVIHFAFSSDPNVIAFCENSKTVEVVNREIDRSIQIATANPQPKMEFSPDGRLLATGGYGNAAFLWSVADGSLVHQLNIGSATGGLTARFSPDGDTLAIGNRNGATRLFDVSTGTERLVLHKEMSQGLEFHPSGDRLAIGYTDGSIVVWETVSGRRVAQKATPADEIYCVAWSPDGNLLASCGRNGDIVIWDGPTLTPLHRFAAPPWVIYVCFSPDGARLISAGGDFINTQTRKVRVWGVPLTQRLLGR
ncbi:WD40 repeat domain-containing protein [Roseiconus nitratireducens]|nr:hypothetical protein [Roseiconus nitratireducens]